MARSSCPYCIDLPFMVDSIDCGQLQFFRLMQLRQLTLLAVMLHMFDSLNFSLKSLHKQWPRRNSAEVPTTVLFELVCLRL